MNLVVKVLLKCVIRCSVSFGTHFRIFCTQISCPLAYGVHISSTAGATPELSGGLNWKASSGSSSRVTRTRCLFYISRKFLLLSVKSIGFAFP